MTHPVFLRTLLLAGALLLHLGALSSRSDAAAGDVDLSFDIRLGVNGPVNAVVVQPDGKVIIGGWFTQVRGLMRTNLARLNADGSGDATFNPVIAYSSDVSSLALQSDGKVLVGGRFNQGVCDEWGCSDYIVAGVYRLNADGSPDNSFAIAIGAGGESQIGVNAIVVQSDGRLLVGGGFSTINGTNRSGIARLNANGTLDTSFNPGTGIGGNQSRVSSVVVQSDDKILIGGYFTSFNGTNRNGIARLSAGGALDAGFNPGSELGGPYVGVNSLALQPDGKVFVGGWFTNANGNGIARFHANGTFDSGFNTGTGVSGAVTSVARQTDGKVLIGGFFNAVNTTNRNGIARLNANGSLDVSFDPGAGASGVNVIALQSNGRIVIGGNFITVDALPRSGVAQLNADGSLDESFYPGGRVDSTSSIVALADGKALVGGRLTFVNGTNQYGSARLNGDGSLDGTFSPGSFNPVVGDLGIPFRPDYGDYITFTAFAVQPDGKVLAGGSLAQVQGCDENGCAILESPLVVRLNSDGSRDTSFTPYVGGGNFSGVRPLESVALQGDGKVLVGLAGHSDFYPGVVRLNTNGTYDPGFNSSGPSVRSVVASADGKLFIGGDFSTVLGMNRSKIARLHSNGNVDATFDPGAGPNGAVLSVALQPDGKVLIGGDFTSFSGTARNRIARLNANGSLDLSFDPGTGADGRVRSIALQPDGNVLIAGDFFTVNGVVRSRIARLHGAAAAPSLTIARSNVFVIVSWSATALNFRLQETTNLALPNSWSPVGQAAVTNAGQISVTVPTTVGRKFFRLQSQ